MLTQIVTNKSTIQDKKDEQIKNTIQQAQGPNEAPGVFTNDIITVCVCTSEITGTRLASNAKRALHNNVEKYAIEIIKEAALLEEGNRENGDEPEITSNYITQAARKYKTYKNQKHAKGLTTLRIVSPLSSLLAGFFFDPSSFNGYSFKLFAFITLLMIATATTVLQHVLDDRE